VTTNLALLQAIAGHPAFVEGQTTTSFLAEHGLLEPGELIRNEAVLTDALYAAALLELTGRPETRERNPWRALGPWRMVGELRATTYIYRGRRYHVTLAPTRTGAWQVRVNAQPPEQVSYTTGPEQFVLLVREHRQTRLHILRQANTTLVSVDGQLIRLVHQPPPRVEDTANAGGSEHAQKALTAPMAGTIVKVQVQDGQEVEQRQVLLILTAMKMEHTIAAPHAGKVRHVFYKEGDVVKGGAVLVEMA